MSPVQFLDTTMQESFPYPLPFPFPFPFPAFPYALPNLCSNSIFKHQPAETGGARLRTSKTCSGQSSLMLVSVTVVGEGQRASYGKQLYVIGNPRTFVRNNLQ